jgi:FkbM family methyltransferase
MIKKLLYHLLPLKTYLQLISTIFFWVYRSGLLKWNKNIACHYFVRKLICKGDYIIDIGANLGYYTTIFSKLTGPTGKVYSVEPIKLYADILKNRTRKLNNVVLIPYALGSENAKQIKMGVPANNGVFRHGLTKVVNNDEKLQHEFTATMYTPEALFNEIDKINYIKCDVEGYEIHIIPLMLQIISKHNPVLQIETVGNHRKQICVLLQNLNYKPYQLQKGKLSLLTDNYNGDIFFLKKEHTEKIKNLIR